MLERALEPVRASERASAARRGNQISVFNASCRSRRFPLRICTVGETSRPTYILEDPADRRVVHVSQSRTVILFLGIAHVLQVFRTDLGSEVLATVPVSRRQPVRRQPVRQHEDA